MKTLIVGAAIVDLLMKIDALPQKGEDIPCTYTATQVGGCAYNVAKIMSLYQKDFDLFVPIGKGNYADIIKKDLEENHIIPLIYDDNEDNGYCLSLIEGDGERTFITVSGIETKFKEEWFQSLSFEDYQDIYITGYQVLSFSGDIISSWLLTQLDKTIFFAPGPVINSIAENVLENIFKCKPIVHLNEKESLSFSGCKDYEQAAIYLYHLCNNYVVITLGEKGVCFYDGKDLVIVPSIKANVVDTIGAGDSHVATIISNYEQCGMYEACRLANKISAKMVTIEGSNMSYEDFNSIHEREEK